MIGRERVLKTSSSLGPRLRGDDWVSAYLKRHPRAGGDPENKYKNEKIPEILTANSRHNQW
jgi:hypothetical protein